MKLQTAAFLSGAVALAVSGLAQAKVSEEEAAKLGQELTPVGAIKAGNEDGSIPAWDPWPRKGDLSGTWLNEENYPDTIGKILAEEPKYVITADNMDQYADVLTEGHKALLKLYPETFKMKVYPTHRNMGYGDKVNKTTIANATSAFLDGCNDCLREAEFGFPFPMPQNGAEAIWNHRLRWRGEYVKRYNNQAIVAPDGNVQLTKLIENVKFPYTLLGGKNIRINDKDDITIYYQSETLAPPRNAGQFLLAWEHVGYRSAWLYNPGLRRVRRAPNVAYDNPYEGTDGQQFYDQVDMYNGALDRYNFKLVGRKEMIIPYNNYAINDNDLSYDDILGKNHMNQDLVRYEKHRVWIVDATLREGTSHQLKRRTFYIDEDGWAIAAVDGYDNRDQLWKVQEGLLVNFLPLSVMGGVPEVIHDLDSRGYFATAMINEDRPNDFSVTYKDRYFSPQSLKRRTSR